MKTSIPRRSNPSRPDQNPVSSSTVDKNRYRNAPRNPDHTIDQRWDTYTPDEHGRWDLLFERQSKLLPGRVCGEVRAAMAALELSPAGIPHFERLSDRLERLTGWRVVAVPDLVPDDVFFEHLANRRFPAGAFIRPANELDYLEEPDVFHDVFGHVPLLANPVFADFMQAYGIGGLRADGLGVLHNLSRLYWYTVEFGLIKSKQGLQIYGAGIASSKSESLFALDDDSPHRLGFDLLRVMRTRYRIDDFQQSYFVIEDFEQLLSECERDFASIYAQLKDIPELAPDTVLEEDQVYTLGSQRYFETKH